MGYDDQRKGWKCCDPITGRCYTSRNVIFDEASSWWSPQEIIRPDSKEIEKKLQERIEKDDMVEEGEEIIQEEVPEEETARDKSPEKSKSPWHTGVHQQIPKEARPSQLEEIQEDEGVVEYGPHLRRTTRKIKKNPKYANAALIEEDNAKEPATYMEASASKHILGECNR